MSAGFIPINFDSEGDPINKSKVTKSKNVLQHRCMVFTTCVSGGDVENNHFDGTDFGDAECFFYDEFGGAVSGDAVSGAVETHFDWEAPYSFDLIDGECETICVLDPPYEKDARLWCVAVPTLPAAFGGSVELITNEVIPIEDRMLRVDGRGVKEFNPDPVYHTNLIRIIVKHKKGQRIRFKMVYDHFWDREDA